MFKSLLNRIISTLFFYIGWVICLKEVSIKHSYYGILLVLACIFYYLYFSSCRKADYFLLSLVLSLGPLSDAFYAKFGLLQYHSLYSLPSWFPPLWVYSLWGLFGINIHLFSWLNGRWWLAILLGALGGPVSYLSVVKLGGASLVKELPLTLVAIGAIWAVFFPSFIWLDGFLKKKFKN